jgi:hypothetical protein
MIKIKKKMVLRHLIVFIMLFLLQSCVTTKFNSRDKRACYIYEKKLDSLSDFLFFGKKINQSNKKSFSHFFETITGHKSEADVSYEGQNLPTFKDYQIWTAWYCVNHNRLRYDKNKDVVFTEKSAFLIKKAILSNEFSQYFGICNKIKGFKVYSDLINMESISFVEVNNCNTVINFLDINFEYDINKNRQDKEGIILYDYIMNKNTTELVFVDLQTNFVLKMKYNKAQSLLSIEQGSF